MSKDLISILRNFVPSNKQIEKMKTFKNNLGKLLLLFPAFLFAQQAPTLQELIDHALVNDGTLTQQTLENK